MSMNTTGVNNADAYAVSYTASSTTKTGTSKKNDEKVSTEKTGVTYEKSAETEDKATYSVNKMSSEDRASLVEQLKSEQEKRQNQLVSIVQQMISKQATSYGQANDIWKFLASGNFTVDAMTKTQAQADIAEDGYYGVKQTSQRLFDFASALAGDDVDKMKEMQAAMEKGFRQATAAWGRKLPSICQETLDAANKLFDDYYASKAESVE